MSKIGKQPIMIPEGVHVTMASDAVTVAGKLGTLRVPILPHTEIEFMAGKLSVSRVGQIKQAAANWGTMRAHLANAVAGVTEGFAKVLEIEGIGFRAALDGRNLVLSLGLAHPVAFSVPEGVTALVEKNTMVTFRGISKELVGQTAARLRALKKPEPYKGKGIHYQGEVIRRKAGKKVAGTAP